MNSLNKRVFNEKISPYLKELIEKIEIEYGENSREYKALYNQYVYSDDEGIEHQESNTKHYEAAIHGTTNLPAGVERLYKRQLVIDVTLVCSTHCRYCLRQNYNLPQFTRRDIDSVVEYCKTDEYLKEILITGGDPFMVPQLLMNLISEIVKGAPNIKIIRIGTRLPVHDPRRFDEELYTFFQSYSKVVLFEVGIQINNKVELQDEAVQVIQKLQQSGVRIYSQNVLLKNINDDIESLAELYDTLRYIGIEAHYLFHPIPMKGTSRFRMPIKRGLDLIRQLTSSGRISGRIKPMFSLMTDIGKVTLYEDSLGEKDSENYYDINTFYKLEDRLKWNPDYVLPNTARINDEGYIVVKYLDGSDD